MNEESMIYLDNAATSHPKPDSVLQAVNQALTEFNANPGRSGHKRALNAARVVLECREALENFLGAEDPMRIIHCFNCTDALNLAIKGCLRQGDHVIASLLEHNSVLRVLSELEARGRISLTLIAPEENGILNPEHYAAAIRPNTRLAVMTQASNVLGTLQPVTNFCQLMRRQGILSLVDGAQAAGIVQVNIQKMGCSLYAFPGHKGLMGPQGTGGLYVAPHVELRPLREGGTGSLSESMRQPSELPDRFESGTVNLPGIAGLLAGVNWVMPRRAQLRDHERMLTSALLEGLASIPGVSIYGERNPAARVGVVSFNLEDIQSGAVADALDRRNIAVRGGLHCAPGTHQFLGTTAQGAVRVSIGPSNNLSDIEALLRSIRQIAQNGTT